MLGLDAARLLDSTDPTEVLVLSTVVEKGFELLAKERRAAAVEIANAVGEMLSGKG